MAEKRKTAKTKVAKVAKSKAAKKVKAKVAKVAKSKAAKKAKAKVAKISSKSEKPTNQSPSMDSYSKDTETITDDEQIKENVMGKKYKPGTAPPQQTADQETVFQDLLRDLCDPSERGIQFRKNIIDFPKSIEGYDLSPDQQITLIAVGHSSGVYAYEPGYGYCCTTAKP